MNERLFSRVKQVYDNRKKFNLTKPQERLLERYYKQMVRCGALLSPEKKAQLKDINEQLAAANLKFGNNIVNDTNNWRMVVDNEADLAGLPDSSIAQAAEEARAAGLEGKWVFTLRAPSRLPFLTYADNRALREKMYKGYINLANNALTAPSSPADASPMMMPASITPSMTAMILDLKSISKKLAASVPVHAPVPGSGIPTNSNSATNRPFPAVA